MEKAEVEFKTNLEQKIKEYIGKKVTIYIGLKDRTTFDNSICVSGTLAQHPELKDHYRVTTIDDGTYTYFTDDVIKRIVGHSNHIFKNGAVAVIQIQIKSQI